MDTSRVAFCRVRSTVGRRHGAIGHLCGLASVFAAGGCGSLGNTNLRGGGQTLEQASTAHSDDSGLRAT